MTDTKICSWCLEEKPISEFGRRPDRGLRSVRSHCYVCSRAQSRAAYRKDIAVSRARNAAAWQTRRASGLLRCARHRAKKSGISCTITELWVQQRLDAGVCEKTGIRFVLDKLRHQFSPSLDKINPKIGYTPENTRMVIFMFNRAKSNFTDDYVEYMADSLSCRGPSPEVVGDSKWAAVYGL